MEETSVLLRKLDEANKLIADQQYALNKAAIVAITDKKGVITNVNDKFCKISGFSKDELIGKTHKIINSGVHDKSFFTQMWKTIASGQVWSEEVCNRAKDGSLYWVDTTIVPFLDVNQIPYQYIAIRNDISHRKMAESAFEKERTKAASAEKMASLGILSSGISHELGNPLGALRGRAEMLERLAKKQESIEASKVGDVANKMIGLIDRMSKIIRGLRAYARDGSQDPFEDIDLGTLVGDIVEISKDRCRRHNVEVTLSGTSDNLHCWGREAELGQVIVNLFNNAVDATKNEKEKWVRIQVLDRDENFVELKIIDSGPGIPENILSKIFDPFFTSKDVGEGTGLGLSITKSIIDTHNGSINVTKENSKTCFEVLLPKTKR